MTELPPTTDMKAYHRAYYLLRRQKIIDHLGGKCVICGATDSLQFDHVDPAQKSVEIKDNLTLDSMLDELAKCQLLCGDCHRKKTSAERAPFTHGSIYGWMKMKCSCATCIAAKWAWHDARNAKRNGPRGQYRKRR